MDKPIISPIFFYLLQLFESIHIAIVVSFVVAIVFIVVAGTTIFCTSYCDGDHDFSKFKAEYPLIAAWFKRAINIFFVSTFLMIFFPTKQTIITMVVTKNVTEQNIETAENIVKSGVDYMFEKINSLKDDRRSE